MRPGVNADPQAEINRQIGFGYDIYVGLLGSRFGTPTPRSGSGTEEEFERALATFQRDSRLVRLLFYFKRASQDPFSVDVEQLGKVNHFREALGPRGVLYHDFQDTNEFVQQLRHHIHSLIVEEWRENAWAQIATPDPDEGGNVSLQGTTPITAPQKQDETLAAERTTPNAQSSNSSPSATDLVVDNTELGYLEYRVEFHRAGDSFVKTFERFSAHLVNLKDRLHVRSSELELLRQTHHRVQHIGGNREGQQYLENQEGRRRTSCRS